jgi:microcompartment protein CcmK/EutM
MRLGQVIGRVTLSRQDPAYTGARLLVVLPLSREQFASPGLAPRAGAPPVPLAKGNSLVVFDNLGASTGAIIGFTEGAEATAPFENPMPIDAFSAGIVEAIHYQPPTS